MFATALLDLQHGQVLEHLAADDEVVGVGRLQRRIGDLADDDAIAHLGRRQLQAALGEVDAVDVDAELPQQVHQRAGTAAEVEHLAPAANTSLMSAGFLASICRRVSSE